MIRIPDKCIQLDMRPAAVPMAEPVPSINGDSDFQNLLWPADHWGGQLGGSDRDSLWITSVGFFRTSITHIYRNAFTV